jgi:PAS domain S-box-containing protein
MEPIATDFTVNEALHHQLAQLQHTVAELQHRQERYTLALHGAQDGVWDWDILANTVYYSPRFHDILGYDVGALGSGFTTFEACLHPGDRQRFLDAIHHHLGHHVPFNSEFRMRTKQGAYRWVMLSGQACWTDDHQPRRMAGIMRDISEQKRQSYESRLLAAVVESSDDAIITKTLDGTITSWNQAAEQLFGYSEAEAVGQSIAMLFPPDRMHEESLIIDLLKNKEKVDHFETIRLTKDGQPIAVSVTISPILDDADEIIGASKILRNIDERRQTDAALKSAKQRLELATKSAKLGVWDLDLVTRHLIWDDCMYALYGMSPEDFDGTYEAWQHRVHPEDLSHALDALQAAVSGDVLNFHDEFRVVWPDGCIRFIEAHGFVVRDDNGTALRMTGINQDISDRKQAELTLENEVLRNTALFNVSIDGIVAVDERGNVVQASPSFAHMLGYTLEEAMHLNVADWDAQWSREELLEVTRGNRVLPPCFETRHRRRDGSIYDVEISYNQILLDGMLIHFCVCRDITERKRAEEALRESEARWQFALEGSGDGVWDWNAQTNEVFFSSQWKAMLGFEEHEIGTSLSEWDSRIHPDDREHCYADLMPHLKGETPVYLNEHRVRCKDGTYKWILDRGKVIERTPDGEPLRAIGTHTDITYRKEAEEALRQANELLEAKVQERTQELEVRARELERSNAELEQFAYVASHDLQEPLRAISSYTELLAEDYGDRLDEEAGIYIDFVVDGATRMQQLIKDLLMFSRVGTRGKSFEPTSCETVVQKVLKGLSLVIHENQAVVTYDSLPTVMADASQIHQLFQNLISNGLKFRAQEPPCIHISARFYQNQWEFCIRDNGIGIESDYFEQIFVIFQRLHSRQRYGGTGIGLAICKKIVQRHGGKIWLDSIVGKGTEFYFTLPADAPPE